MDKSESEEELNIEGLMLEGIADGILDFAGIKNGELAVKLTKKGEAKVKELVGGEDVLRLTNKIFGVLVKHGAFGFPVPDTVNTIVLIARILSVAKHYGTWAAFVKAGEK